MVVLYKGKEYIYNPLLITKGIGSLQYQRRSLMVYHKLDHETTNAQNNRYKKNHILNYILIYVPCFKLHIILC